MRHQGKLRPFVKPLEPRFGAVDVKRGLCMIQMTANSNMNIPMEYFMPLSQVENYRKSASSSRTLALTSGA